MLWSWWPWVAIITSASSKTNTLIFLGSMNFSLEHQSSTVPGVPITICSEIFWPLSTAKTQRESFTRWLCRQRNALPPLPLQTSLFHHLTGTRSWKAGCASAVCPFTGEKASVWSIQAALLHSGLKDLTVSTILLIQLLDCISRLHEQLNTTLCI